MKYFWVFILSVGLVVGGCSDDDPVRPVVMPITGLVLAGDGEPVVGAAVIVTYELPTSAVAKNPDKPRTMITYEVLETGPIRLWITSACADEVVRTLVEGVVEPGQFSHIWDGQDDDGLVVTSGVYQYHLEAGGETASADLVLLVNDYAPDADPTLYRHHALTDDEGRFRIEQDCLPFGYVGRTFDEMGTEIGSFTISRQVQLHALHADHPTGVSAWVRVDEASGAEVTVTVGN